MKLIKTRDQLATAGLPASHREWWDIGKGYEIYVAIGGNSCTIGVHASKKSITYEVANLLGLDTGEQALVKRQRGEEELYVQMGIDCVVIVYKKPKNYKALLKKIEMIVNENFKNK